MRGCLLDLEPKAECFPFSPCNPTLNPGLSKQTVPFIPELWYMSCVRNFSFSNKLVFHEDYKIGVCFCRWTYHLFRCEN
jgi:hypothetical protein